MEEPPSQLPTGTLALFKEIFPRPADCLMAYGWRPVSAVAEAVHTVDDAFVHGNAPEILEAHRKQRQAEQRRKFAAWAAEHCDPKYREILLDEF